MSIKAYKGFNKDMTCRGFHFKEGESYEEPEARLCESGFHACLNPLDCINYYSPSISEFHEVWLDELSDEREFDTKVCAKKIKIGDKLDVHGLCKAHFEFVKSNTSNTKIDGNESSVSVGDESLVLVGYESHVSTGNKSSVSTGDYSRISSGSESSVSGGTASAVSVGKESSVMCLSKSLVSAGDKSSVSSGSASSVSVGVRSLVSVDGASYVSAGDGSFVSAGSVSYISTGWNSSVSTGDYSLVSSGIGSIVSAGSRSYVSAGYGASVSVGDESSVSCNGKASSGNNSLIALRGSKCKAKGGIGTVILIANEHDNSYNISEWKAGVIDGKTLKPDTWYRLENGEFVECDDDVE